MHMNRTIICLLILALLCSVPVPAQLRLPKLIGNGMVLQRDAAVKVWGWAAPGERVDVRFNDSVWHATADSLGAWSAILSNLKAGGPSTMTITASDTVTIRDVVVGDVWICSGQSNMELHMSRVSPIYRADIAASANPFIRQFTVPQNYNFTRPQQDLQSGDWESADPATVLRFSAAAYFFARELYARHHVPIGFINASLGGSPAEAWMSEGALKQFPAHLAEAQKYKDTSLIVRIDSMDRARSNAWYGLLREKDEGCKDAVHPWSSTGVKTADWQVMNVPGYWSATPLGPVNGVVWFRKDVNVPARMTGVPAALTLGRIVDADSVFVNGVCVGTTGYQYPPRRYTIPAGLLKAGRNTIVIRVISTSGSGGFVLDKPYEISANGKTVDLKGPWRFRLGAVMEPLASQTFIRWKPVGLYNGMFSPLRNYAIKGVVWYQGESNAGRPAEYVGLFPALIRDWRTTLQQGDVPFIFVQLPNFMEAKSVPSESNWALLREAQAKALSQPNTAMAVAIDIGEWNDIHPLNKKDIGKRLALAAESIAYGDTSIVHSGPAFQSMSIKGNRAVLSFAHIGGGLITRGGKALNGFAVADSSGKFFFAHARIVRNTVVVWHDKVAHPAAVRYAWADNPQSANLYNKAGLPASPFRTDDWRAR